MNKTPYIVTAILVVSAGLCALLEKYWSGLVYFVLGLLFVLASFWGVWLIVSYFTTYKQEIAEKFELYRAQFLNESNISISYFNENIEAYQKQFQKSLLKEKILKWCTICLCFAIAVSFLLSMIYI